MASTFSTNLAIELIGTGDQAGTWGVTTNTNLGTLVEQAISGYVTQAVSTGADTTITIPNGATGVARNMYIELTGTGGASTNLIVPANKKLYFIFNNTSSGQVTVKVSGQTGVSVPNGKKVVLVCNGTDIVNGLNYIADFGTNSFTVTNLTATSATITNLIATSASITTLTNNPTFSAGTANGVLYLNGSKVATSGTALVFDGSNLGLGVTPSTSWFTDYRVMQVGLAGAVFNDNFNEDLNVSSNSYADTRGGYKFIRTGYAQRYTQTNSGQHQWRTSTASGTAGNTISFTQALTLNTNGALVLQGGNTAASGVGVAFPATQSASSDANTLDDYEEGTFTPVVSGTTTPGVGTYGTQNGQYVKIGKLVQYQIYIVLTAHTGTGNIAITGLPFTASSGNYPASSIYVDSLALTAGNYPQIAVLTSGTEFLIRQYPTGGGAATAIPMDTQFDILLCGTYQV